MAPVQEETIYHMAGAKTPTALSTDDIERSSATPGASPSSATPSTTRANLKIQ